MQDAAIKALEMIEKGAAKIGEYGPVVWAELVKFHLFTTIGNFAALVIVMALGAFLWFGPGLSAWRKADDVKEYGQRDLIVTRALIHLIPGAIAFVVGTIGTLGNLAHFAATVYAPSASLLYKLLEVVKK